MIWQVIASLLTVAAVIVLPLGLMALLWRGFERYPGRAVIVIVVGIALLSATALMLPHWFLGCYYDGA